MSTRDTITTDDGTTIAFVLLIEGYPRVLTNWDDTDAVLTAYATTTDWTQALRGLHVPGDIHSRIALFSLKVDAESMRFVISPDDDDTFGTEVHRTSYASGVETRLESGVDSNDATIVVQDASGFAEPGEIHIGTECISYQGHDNATDFDDTVQRGRYAPFKADSEAFQRFGRPHRLATIAGNAQRPRVTSYARTMIGRTVRLLAHAVHGGVLDTFANAETLFAGVVEEIHESESGATLIDCVGYQQRVAGTLLLRDQFVGKVRDGIYLRTGIDVSVREEVGGIESGVAILSVVASGATPPGQINEGYYSAGEICSAIGAAIADGSFTGEVSIQVSSSDLGPRVSISAEDYGIATQVVIRIHWDSGRLAKAMGFDELVTHAVDSGADPRPSVAAERPPVRAQALQEGNIAQRMELSQSSGTLCEVDSDFLLEQLRQFTGTGWVLLSVGGTLIIAHQEDSLAFDQVYAPTGLQQALGASTMTVFDLIDQSVLYEGDPGHIEVRQVMILQGEFKEIFLRLFASTGTSGYNVTTYDAFPEQLGIGVPWEMLGTQFESALDAMQSLSQPATVTIALDAPTAFERVLLPELLLRNYHLIQDRGQLKLVAPGSGAATVHALVTSNKASPSGTADAQRSSSVVASDLLKTKLTVKYDRGLDGQFRRTRTIVNLASQTDHGGDYPVTIEARNTFGGGIEDTVDDLMSRLGSLILGVFSFPLKRVVRTISRKFFHMRPGDSVELDDDHVRDPETGLRGVAAFPCWVEEVHCDWSTGVGQVTLIMVTGDKPAAFGLYSPSARMASYVAGTKQATLDAHVFTHSSDSDVDADHFNVGDKIRFIEESPANPVSPSTHVDTIVAKPSTHVITLTTGFSPTGGTTYYVVSDDRATAVASQRLDCYLADDADSKIGSAPANLWSGPQFYLGSVGDPAEDYYRFPYDLSDTEGEPCSTWLHFWATYNRNTLVGRKTAVQMPTISGTLDTGWEIRYTSVATDNWRLAYSGPFYVGRGQYPALWQRLMKVAPMLFRVSGSNTVFARVTISKFPPVGSSLLNVSYPAPIAQATWSTTSSTPVYGSQEEIAFIGAADLQGPCHISVDLKATATEVVAFCGLGEFWQGPMDKVA